jgi:hypothetical protein
MKQPDRFERIVDKEMRGSEHEYPLCAWMSGNQAVKLLRREHAAIVRMLKQYMREHQPPGSERCVELWETYYMLASVCGDLLRQLDKRRR